MSIDNTENCLPEISIVMPVYNAQEYLRQTIDSVLNQTMKNFELICVDDGSTDTSPEILEEYQKKDDRVRVLHQQNQFAGAARNNGLEESVGEYLVFWDSDDIFDATALEKMYQKCVEDQADMCICGAYRFEEDISKPTITDVYLKEQYLPDHTPFYHEDIDPYLYTFSGNICWNKMFRKKMLMDHNIRYQNYRHGEDTMFAMAAYFYAESFTVVKEKLIYYRANNINSLTGKMYERPMDTLHSYEDTYHLLEKEENFKNVVQSFRDKFIGGMMFDLKHHADVTTYETMFEEYRKRILEWDFPEEEEAYINNAVYRRVMDIKKGDFKQFLLSEYELQERNAVRLRGRVENQKARIKKLKATITQQNKRHAEEEKRLKKQLTTQMEKKVAEIENSTSYRLGRKITWIPRKIKSTMNHKE